MSGYMSETEDIKIPNQLGGAGRKQSMAKTVKQRLGAKARRDARAAIHMSDTLPHEVKSSGFHYDEESSREVLEESQELGNQTDNESDTEPIIRQHNVAYKVVSSHRPGSKPKLQVRGLVLDYDNTQSPFVSATYLNNGKVVEGVLNTAVRQGNQTYMSSGKQRQVQKRRKRIIRTQKRKNK